MKIRVFGVLLACFAGLTPELNAGHCFYGPYSPSYGYASYNYTPTYYSASYPYTYSYYPASTHYGKFYPAGNYAYYGGHWYMQGYSGPFYGYDVPQTYTTSATAYSADWRSKLLDVAKARDDLVAYQQALDKLSLSGTAGVLQGSSYSHGYATPVVGAYGANGNTSYGYSVNGYSVKQVAEAYGSFDTNALLQAYGRVVQTAQQLDGQAVGNLGGIVKTVMDSRNQGLNQAADTLARGLAAAAALQAANGPPGTRQTTTTTVIGTGQQSQGNEPTPYPSPQQVQPNAAVNAQWQAFMQTVAVPQCAKCHGEKDPKGKFSIYSLPQLDVEGRANVLERVVTGDPELGMPRDAAGKHSPLTREQRRLWIRFFSQ